jgi:hypothetical protein
MLDNVQGMRRSSHIIKTMRSIAIITGIWRSPELPQAAERIPVVIRRRGTSCLKLNTVSSEYLFYNLSLTPASFNVSFALVLFVMLPSTVNGLLRIGLYHLS